MKPQVSIVLPFKDAEATIMDSIQSVLEQSDQNWELRLIDDHSRDKSGDLIKKVVAADSRVFVHLNPGEGICDALNHGIEESTSSLIARMDADDLMRKNRIFEQSVFMRNNPGVGLVASKVSHIDEMPGGKARGYRLYVSWTNTIITTKDIMNNRFIESPFAHPSVMFQKQIIEKFGGYRKGNFPEDYELWLRWMHKGVVMKKLNQTLLDWRDHPDRLSRKDISYSKKYFQQTKACYLALWIEENLPPNTSLSAWGTGKVAKKQLNYLKEHGIRIAAFYDVDPRKIGNPLDHVIIKSNLEIPDKGKEFILVLVGNQGARLEIQSFLNSRGYEVGKDFLFLT